MCDRPTQALQISGPPPVSVNYSKSLAFLFCMNDPEPSTTTINEAPVVYVEALEIVRGSLEA